MLDRWLEEFGMPKAEHESGGKGSLPPWVHYNLVANKQKQLFWIIFDLAVNLEVSAAHLTTEAPTLSFTWAFSGCMISSSTSAKRGIGWCGLLSVRTCLQLSFASFFKAHSRTPCHG